MKFSPDGVRLILFLKKIRPLFASPHTGQGQAPALLSSISMAHLSLKNTFRWLSLGSVILYSVGCALDGQDDAGSGDDNTGGSASGGLATGGLGSGGVLATGGMGLGTGGDTQTGGGGGSGGLAGSGGLGSGGLGSGGVPGAGGTPATGGADPGTGGADGDPTCDAGIWDGGEPEVLSLSGNTFAHDPTMIKAGGTYHRFWTGNFIQHATSSNLTNWSNAPTVYGNSYPSWSDSWLAGVSGETFNFPWAPDVSYFGGAYHLYSSFSAKFGDNISCITHLSTTDINSGDWTDHGPVICTEGNEDYNAIDADVGVTTDGTPWLSFGSFWGGLYAFELNQDGSRKDDNLTHLAWASQIEAPVLFYRCGYYYLFVTWGLCCPGEGRSVDDLTYRVAVGRSTSITGPYVDKNGTPLTEGGGSLLVEGDGVNWAAAGHSDVLLDGDKIYHFYHAYRQSNGGAELRIVELPFDDDGWPVAGGP